MITAFGIGRNSIGFEIDPEYCRMAGRYLKAESPDLNDGNSNILTS
jgi:site-specific DNA-methyltransferase (adenine-specific)